LIAIRNAVVRFVYNDRIEEIRIELSEPFFPHKRLYRAYHHAEPTPDAAFLRFFHRTPETCGFGELVCGLVQQFPTVGEHKHALSVPHAILNKLAEHDGLATTRGQYEQCAAAALGPFRLNRRFRFLLIRS